MKTHVIARTALAGSLAAIYGTLGMARQWTNALRSAGTLRPAVIGALALTAALLVAWLLRDRRSRRPPTFFALGAIAALYAGLLSLAYNAEEMVHFLEYGLVALLARAAAPVAWRPGRAFAAAALFTAAAGWVDELLQGLLPNRFYDLRDVAFNAAAGLTALGAAALLTFLRERRAR